MRIVPGGAVCSQFGVFCFLALFSLQRRSARPHSAYTLRGCWRGLLPFSAGTGLVNPDALSNATTVASGDEFRMNFAPLNRIFLANFGESPKGEVRRIPILGTSVNIGTSVNKAASVSVYMGGHLFEPRERKNEIVGTVAQYEVFRGLSNL